MSHTLRCTCIHGSVHSLPQFPPNWFWSEDVSTTLSNPGFHPCALWYRLEHLERCGALCSTFSNRQRLETFPVFLPIFFVSPLSNLFLLSRASFFYARSNARGTKTCHPIFTVLKCLYPSLLPVYLFSPKGRMVTPPNIKPPGLYVWL